ncbi:hypothetical protein BH09DEP1_BH09DEP1_5780 [soil metagenome]
MYKIIIAVLFISHCVCAMDAPVPPNRFFLRDLMQAYAQKKQLDLQSKSKATLADIKNWIEYARANESARLEFAGELQGTPEDVENALDILQFEIEQVEGAPANTIPVQPIARKLPPTPQPQVLGNKLPPTRQQPKPAARKLPSIPQSVPQPVARPTVTGQLLNQLAQKNAIQKRDGTIVQLKTIDQFKLGQGIGPATCPVQALRNTLNVLRFVHTGLPTILGLLDDANDARKFLELVEKCGVGIQWLTADELGRIIRKMEGISPDLRNEISAIDTPQELLLYPDQLKIIQDKFKQQNATHGFIIGTMDIGQSTGERGHYFSLVINKDGSDYLYLITDTAPGSNHLDPNSYNYKRVRYIADLITKGRSDINLDAELQKLAGVRSKDILARALQRGVLFDFKSLSKNELEGLEKAAQEADRNRGEWKNRMRMDDAQLGAALQNVKNSIRERATVRS